MKPLHSASGTGIGYNPGISYRGGELLGAGLAQAGNALAEGLQQFTKNREEREFADQKMQALAAQMGRFQDFEKASNEDDRSPAGQFIKTFANWDNLSLAKKKASLVDAELFVNKREAEQRRAEDQQWRMLGEQRAIEEQQRRAKLESDRLAEELRSNRVREDLAWLNRMDTAGQRVFDNVRAMDADRLREQDTRSQVSLRAAQEQEILNNLKAGGPGTFSEDPVSGMRFYEKRNTVLPSGVNPDKAFGARQITGPGGESLGFGLPSRSGVQPMRDQTQLTAAQREQANARRRSDLLKSYNEELKALSNPLNWDGTTAAQRAQHRQQIQQEIDALRDESGRSESTPSAPGQPATPASPPTITTQAQFDALPSGATYKGKDGRTYRKP